MKVVTVTYGIPNTQHNTQCTTDGQKKMRVLESKPVHTIQEYINQLCSVEVDRVWSSSASCMLNLRKSSPKPGVRSSASHAGKFVEVDGGDSGLERFEGTCELPLVAVAVDVAVVVRSIWAVTVARSSILAFIRRSVRFPWVPVRIDSSSVAGGDSLEKIYELGEGTNVALAKMAAAETEGSTIAARDGLLFFLLSRRDFGMSALDCTV